MKDSNAISRAFMLFFIFLFLIAPVKAIGQIKLVDYGGDTIEDGIVFIEFDINNTKEQSTLQVFDGYIPSNMPKNQEIEIYLDKQDTLARDFYIKTTITNNNQTVRLQEIGLLRGTVIDKLENVVDNAELKFECAKESDFPDVTDRFGSFSITAMPVGTCKIYAMYKGATGHKIVDIMQGEITDVEIMLDKTLLSYSKKNYRIYDILIVILLAVVASLLYVWYRNIRPDQKKTENKAGKEQHMEDKTQESKIHKKTEAILPTLSKKEKQVVEFLLNDKDNESTQRTLFREVGIPRTSLTRILEGLERKKILTVEKIGKMKRIKLTDWFLGKE